ncbi:hypothetical protein [Rhizobium sp. WYCCWR 11128]|uniref:hypothetical protein n=1 Tax=Rhizobium sp. WYCCWR 11128 TaxID=2749832 RepID=UPI0015D200F1|nr:hypothetical protein [Rhizobium sp. WYCCWR 11128]NYT30534.1 hypothetical protein [Rhizobium sp. WYCCWR 11128]
MGDEFEHRSTAELLTMHAAIMEELRSRRVLRSANNPTGDLAEHLFCAAFGWHQVANSVKGYDATGDNGLRYQIKGRRNHRRNKSRQLSAIRDLDGFDVLAVVLFDRVTRAALVPTATVRRETTYVEHTNSHKFMARKRIWNIEGVLDVTDKLQGVV